MDSFIVSFKKILRKVIRKILFVRSGETIHDSVTRHKIKIIKLFDHRKASIQDFENCLKKCGISKGDTIILHSSWRGCYSLKCKPEEVIEKLIDYIGDEGNILMPSYGNDYHFFDVDNTKSNAGILSELFRLKYNPMRSAFPVCSMSVLGSDSDALVSDHINSSGAFDKKSPYYKAIILKNAKIVFLGLGKRPYKITAFHFSSYALKDKIPYYERVYSVKMKAIVRKDNKDNLIEYITSKDYVNNRFIFRRLAKKCHPSIAAVNGITMVSIDGKKAIDTSSDFCLHNGKIYKKRKTIL